MDKNYNYTDYNNGPAQKFMMTRVSEPIKLDNGTYRISMYTNQKISFDIDAGKERMVQTYNYGAGQEKIVISNNLN